MQFTHFQASNSLKFLLRHTVIQVKYSLCRSFLNDMLNNPTRTAAGDA
jgi:hypothetical protein